MSEVLLPCDAKRTAFAIIADAAHDLEMTIPIRADAGTQRQRVQDIDSAIRFFERGFSDWNYRKPREPGSSTFRPLAGGLGLDWEALVEGLQPRIDRAKDRLHAWELTHRRRVMSLRRSYWDTEDGRAS